MNRTIFYLYVYLFIMKHPLARIMFSYAPEKSKYDRKNDKILGEFKSKNNVSL